MEGRRRRDRPGRSSRRASSYLFFFLAAFLLGAFLATFFFATFFFATFFLATLRPPKQRGRRTPDRKPAQSRLSTGQSPETKQRTSRHQLRQGTLPWRASSVRFLPISEIPFFARNFNDLEPPRLCIAIILANLQIFASSVLAPQRHFLSTAPLSSAWMRGSANTHWRSSCPPTARCATPRSRHDAAHVPTGLAARESLPSRGFARAAPRAPRAARGGMRRRRFRLCRPPASGVAASRCGRLSPRTSLPQRPSLAGRLQIISHGGINSCALWPGNVCTLAASARNRPFALRRRRTQRPSWRSEAWRFFCVGERRDDRSEPRAVTAQSTRLRNA